MKYTSLSRCLGTVVCSLYLAAGLAHAAADGQYERGPAPTIDALQADSGPFSVDAHVISRRAASAYGYGGGTVYFPKDTGQTYGVLVFTPGFTGVQSVYAPLASRIASHGFVVVNIDTLTTFDQPSARALEMAGALKQVVNLAKAGNVPFAASTDTTRRAVIGHSMGGGGTLIDATNDSSLKAAVAFMPWSQLKKNFAADEVPTMIVVSENDTVAPAKQFSDVFYDSLSTDLPRAEVEIKGAGHLAATSAGGARNQTTVVKSAVSWLKVFLDEDARYLPFVKGGIDVGDYSRFETKGF